MRKNNILVCVTQQKTCERLIKQGARMKKYIHGSELFVFHVVMEGSKFLGSNSESEALEYLFSVTKVEQGSMVVTRSSSTIKSIVDFAKDNNISEIVIGEGPEGDTNEETIINKLERLLPDVNINVISRDE